MKRGILFMLGLIFLASACQKDSVDQMAIDQDIIAQYMQDNNLTDFIEHESGMHYKITEEGTGTGSPTNESNVEVIYKGTFTDGTVFDQTPEGETTTFALSGVIEGWQEALPLLKKNGKGTFLLPSELGYGSRPPYFGFPVNAVLIFEIELIDFN
jgi:FKBP-type peptidyl-prolyl cis-trans isomerase FkpA